MASGRGVLGAGDTGWPVQVRTIRVQHLCTGRQYPGPWCVGHRRGGMCTDRAHRDVTKVPSGVPEQSPRACVTRADREPAAAGVGDSFSDLPTLAPAWPGLLLARCRAPSHGPSQASAQDSFLASQGPRDRSQCPLSDARLQLTVPGGARCSHGRATLACATPLAAKKKRGALPAPNHTNAEVTARPASPRGKRARP